MITIAEIHDLSETVEKTLARLRQLDTDDKEARAALLDLYLAGHQAGVAANKGKLTDRMAHALAQSKQALQTILAIEKEAV